MAAAAIAVVLAAGSTVFVDTTANAQGSGPTGSASHDAAASCWEIKQNDPDAPDGSYWLQTPSLVAPERFYCDMTTDGGGWVLIGRGRQDWRQEYQGQGTPAQVRDAVTGQDAFTVRSLPSRTVDGLLNDGRVDALDDGIRVRRAKNTSGTSWQDARFEFENRDRWVWSFGAEHRVGSYDFGGFFGSGSGGQTNDFGKDDSYRRIDTRNDHSGQGWLRGWSYGSRVSGSNSADSYLWSETDGAGHARPFTQIYLRPKLTQDDLDYTEIAEQGTAPSERRPLLQSGAEPQEWGVTGRATSNTNEHYTEARTFGQSGDTVFVGGNFRNVQKGPDPGPGERIEQSYLAGFDVDTGDWVSSFRPDFNGPVRALSVLPSGLVVAGGEFTEVNGESNAGLVALDPATGDIADEWHVAMENRLTCCSTKVWTLEQQGDWLYVGGSFTHMRGMGQSRTAYSRNTGRIDVSTASPDQDWNPEFNGTVFDLDTGADGDRIYAAGHFTWSQHEPAEKVAVVSTEQGAPLVPGMADPSFSNSTNYQQTILEAGDRVWVGGSEHSLFSYARSDFELLSGNITKNGGDFQATELIDGVVYGTCHCRHWNYSDAYTWQDVGTDWTQADKLGFIGAWDAETGEYLPEFNARLNGHRDQGPWDVFQDSTGTVWFSGDFRQGLRQNGWSWTWLGGFARFEPRDTTAPTVPGSLSSTDNGDDTVRLSWKGSTDDRGSVSYEVLKDDRVVAVRPWQTEVEVPDEPGRYFVRAVDDTGNRSASTSAHDIGGSSGGA
ncbi:fibrinogen-like YCDxxxxGGGW domain-containing protein [Prauserella halophila]|uniref:fibrinogen-like YCDxxxxGGGW domain-containing protein n=1 Tax=Prauserella halophila TaxID=185641 RepID=UPI0020A603DC|nr:fibrinogen-like YCDxxxxGGGW domain-containing protein [Prauserella halophila]